MESGEGFEHLELFDATGAGRGPGAAAEIGPVDRTAIGDSLRDVCQELVVLGRLHQGRAAVPSGRRCASIILELVLQRPHRVLLACGALPFLFVRLTSMRCQPVALTFRGV